MENNKNMMFHLTRQEQIVIQRLADAVIEFNQLPEYHPSDASDFAFHIHALQNIVMGRIAVRQHPDLFHTIPELWSKA